MARVVVNARRILSGTLLSDQVVSLDNTIDLVSVKQHDNATDAWSDSNMNAVSRLWTLSEREQHNLRQLKERLEDIDYPRKNNPDDVVRFLLARHGDVNAAEAMFRKMVAWRLANRVDHILQEFQPADYLVKSYPASILEGYDKDGDPIFLERLGIVDGVSILKKFGRDHFLKHSIWIRELVTTGSWIAEYEKKHGRQLNRVTIIEDLYGLGRSHLNRHVLDVYNEIMRLDQDNYPETAKKIIIIRAPAVFCLIWAIAKYFFDTNVANKMIFCGASDYTEILQRFVDLSVLPPSIVAHGKGRAMSGMPGSFECCDLQS